MYYKFDLEQISLVSDKSAKEDSSWLTVQAILAVAERLEALNQTLEAITKKEKGEQNAAVPGAW